MEACYGGTDVMERSCAVARGIEINIITGKHSDTRIKPLPLTNGHGRYIHNRYSTPERALLSVGEWPLHTAGFILTPSWLLGKETHSSQGDITVPYSGTLYIYLVTESRAYTVLIRALLCGNYGLFPAAHINTKREFRCIISQ
jgi:hypothetical protein